MDEGKHTPLDEDDVAELDAFLAAYSDEPSGDLVERSPKDDLLTWGILRRVLRAVNSHHALAEENQRLREALERTDR